MTNFENMTEQQKIDWCLKGAENARAAGDVVASLHFAFVAAQLLQLEKLREKSKSRNEEL